MGCLYIRGMNFLGIEINVKYTEMWIEIYLFSLMIIRRKDEGRWSETVLSF